MFTGKKRSFFGFTSVKSGKEAPVSCAPNDQDDGSPYDLDDFVEEPKHSHWGKGPNHQHYWNPRPSAGELLTIKCHSYRSGQ